MVLAAGALLRITLLASYTPSILNYPDTWGYVRAAAGPLFHRDDVRPVGYALLLRALHGVSPTLVLVVTFQHVLGLASVILVYIIVRRLGQSRLVAIAPAAVVALSPDFLYFEHSLLTETTFMFLLLASLYAAVRGLEQADLEGRPSRSILWLAVGGTTLGAATTIRSVGFVLIIPVTLCVVAFRQGKLRSRFLAGLTVVASGGMVVAGYSLAHLASTGSFMGPGTGWALYSRAAPFADCRNFDPPTGTESLCETTPARQRFGGDFYGWNEGSPARRAFIGPPFHDDEVGAFGTAAIRAQPGDYLHDVLRDIWRYVDSDAGSPRPHSGAGPEALAIDLRDPAAEGLNRSVVEPYYRAFQIGVKGPAHILAGIQTRLRFGGLVLLVTAMLPVVALPFSKGAERKGLVLFGLTAFLLPIMSAATAIYNWRYLVPVLPELIASGAMGASILVRRGREAISMKRTPAWQTESVAI